MNSVKRNRIGKTIVGVTLSLSIAFSGSMLVAPGSVHAAAAVSDSSTSSTASKIIAKGKQYLGVRYEFGAESGQTRSFDCSSFTQYIYGKFGIDLPRSSREQAKVGTKVSKSQLKPGDLIFTDTDRDGKINHVSIYMGNDKLLHTYKVGVGVTISNFKGSTWDDTFVTARRVIPSNGQADNGSSNNGSGSGQSGNDNGSSGNGNGNGNSNDSGNGNNGGNGFGWGDSTWGQGDDNGNQAGSGNDYDWFGNLFRGFY
ncbi:C40 family peptidase [Paenibacillus thalictri]|uniref:NlpC/P60 family protein n=1 Tax=Paenibacillus thalictri TaxID=2527873 RepID=A0A4Q9DI40_9BACL|nr:C40 family peptidase [Paenibacillus thalictri]TBL70746.1 NlpC/P60 family protein [Paenibacillus thalictri]